MESTLGKTITIRSMSKLLNYAAFRRFGEVFVETGSGHGDGIQRALDAGFSQVISIEAQPENFKICAVRFMDQPRVKLLLGTSQEWLPIVLKECHATMLFYLDAHVSGEKSFGYADWLAGDVSARQDTIIRNELEILLQTDQRPLIIMDDINGHADGLADEYAAIIEQAKPGYTFYFYDENLGEGTEHFYKDKLLVAIPNGA